jgi:predicted metal-dependent hydrolase
MNPEYLEGIRLFNAGHYWHAHEQWEQCWLQSSGQDALFYKAIIQAAAALVKWRQGNLRGLALNWAKSSARLAELPPHYQGLDLVGLRTQIDRIAANLSAAPPLLSLDRPPPPR